MNKMKRQRKGFTLTELAIVIAVIAILIAVLVPTFISLINKANESSDKQLVTNLNTALSVEEAEGNAPEKVNGVYNVTDAITSLQDYGYDISKLTPSADNNDIVYNATTNRFVYYTDNFSETSNEVTDGDTLVIIDSLLSRVSAAQNALTAYTVQYCVYSTDTFVSLSNDSAITVWLYTRSYDGTTVTINLPNGTVYDFSIDSDINITAVNTSSYHLYGSVNSISLTYGHVKLESGSKTTTLTIASATNTKLTYSDDAEIEMYYAVGDFDSIYNENDTLKTVNAETFASSKGVTVGTMLTESNVSKLSESGYYKLAEDITCTSQITIDGANVYLDLNGHTLTMNDESNTGSSTSYQIKLSSEATLTISDTSADSDGKVITDLKATLIYGDDGTTINLNSGILENAYSTGYSYATCVYCLNSTFNMTGGTIKMTNCTSNSSKALWIYSNSSGNAVANISGGTFINNGNAIAVQGYGESGGTGSLTINISGGTFGTEKEEDNKASATILINNMSNNIDANMVISNGTIYGSGSNNYSVQCSLNSNVTITGGTIGNVYIAQTSSTAIVKTSMIDNKVVNVICNSTLKNSVSGNYTYYSVGYDETNGYAYIEGKDYYKTLATAVSAAEDGDIIKLNKDCTSTDTSVVNVIGKSITIDFNGHNIDSKYYITAYSGGSLILKNSVSDAGGTFTYTGSSYAILVQHNATITIEDSITVTTSTASTTVFVGLDNNTVNSKATLNVYGKLENTGSGYAIVGNGTDKLGGTVINIYDGATITSNNWAIYHPQYGTLNIEGGTITAGVTAIEMRAGTLNIAGGTITSEAESTDFNVEANDSGTTVSGVAIAISQHTTQMAITVTISGGSISGYYALYEVDTVTTTTLSENVSITISGTAELSSTVENGTAIYSANNIVTDSRS